ncbi:MAG: hypothetical protein K9J42_12470 [Sulfuritalea sp.]|nr:hypothetical protein [Sulfuritalea sp.]
MHSGIRLRVIRACLGKVKLQYTMTGTDFHSERTNTGTGAGQKDAGASERLQHHCQQA